MSEMIVRHGHVIVLNPIQRGSKKKELFWVYKTQEDAVCLIKIGSELATITPSNRENLEVVGFVEMDATISPANPIPSKYWPLFEDAIRVARNMGYEIEPFAAR